jgi:hypothetical protein
MENTSFPPVKLIVKDAVISLPVGTGMIERFQQLFIYLTKDLTDEQYAKYQQEFKDFKAIAKKEKEFSEPWMYPVTTVKFLLDEITKQADLQKVTFEVNLEDYVKAQVAKSENIPPADQSQSQPE